MMSSARKNGTKWRKSLPPLVKRQHSAEIVCLTEMRLWEWEWVSGYWLLGSEIAYRKSEIVYQKKLWQKMICDWRYSIADTCPTPGGYEVWIQDQRSHIAYQKSQIK